ncbi:hypothetical protein IMCC20628_03959 [Hoeflea sp. IMCC20628]|uniref:hypothetical protein n=1 Tax=Hoeflea sp. IMCC20628 TaxID=1620421 RepID=UPI00063A908F|nr:hypothetical protein [Hoeflea sp. IMCC20628]AKI02640.1 hypothetical protein IMCC20628_03959 [Hoeflea sp. IMCC20628]
MGALVRNLYHVDGRWKFRKVVPVRLRSHIDGSITEFVRWLGQGPETSPEVMSAYAKASAECEELFALASKRSNGSFDELSDQQLPHIIAIARSHLLAEDEEDRFDDEADVLFDSVRKQVEAMPGAFVKPDEVLRFDKRQETLEEALKVWKHEYSRGIISPFIREEVTDLAASHGYYLDPAGLSFRRLAKAYLVLQIEVTKAMLKRQRGKAIATPEAPAEPVAAATREPSVKGSRLREMGEKKLAMKKKSHATTEATETALRLFESVYGDREMSGITRREVAEWIFLLQQKPRLPEKAHRTLPLRDLVAAYKDRPDVPRLTGKSVNGHVSHLNSIWAWSRQRGFIDRSLDNPFSEQRVDETARQADPGFTSTQLQAIFDLPVFTQGERPKGGRGEAAFWIPLLLLIYGTRPEEMCQLLVSDIHQSEEDGLWCLKITDEGLHPVKGARHLKADGNPLIRRTLPVAKRMLDLGFIEYVDQLRRSGEEALFPLLTTKGRRNYLHAGFATWWGQYLRDHNAIPDSGNKPLRDFRGTWTTAASASGVREEERDWIQGHYYGKGKTSNRSYGVRDYGEMINQVEFKGLDLSKLRT